MPTETQCIELINNTNVTKETINGVVGYKFTNKDNSSKYIFIPTAGNIVDWSLNNVGLVSGLWSSSSPSSGSILPKALSCNPAGKSVLTLAIRSGLPVRGVSA